MNRVFVFLSIICLSKANEIEWTDLRCKFSMFDIFRINSFFHLPRSERQARDAKWVQPPEINLADDEFLTSYCEKDDGRICLLFDKKGTVAGYQVGIPRSVDSLSIPNYNFEEKGFQKKILFGNQFYTIRSYFTSQDTIKKGGRAYNGLTGEGLWLPLGNKSLVEIPLNEFELASKVPLFKKQSCFTKMGQHYFYNLTKNIKPNEFLPYFLLYSNRGELQGFGLNTVGSNALSKNSFKDYIPFLKKRDWFESVPSSAIRKVAPDAPQWMLDYADKYGIISHHVYMIPQPWDFTCATGNSD